MLIIDNLLSHPHPNKILKIRHKWLSNILKLEELFNKSQVICIYYNKKLKKIQSYKKYTSNNLIEKELKIESLDNKYRNIELVNVNLEVSEPTVISRRHLLVKEKIKSNSTKYIMLQVSQVLSRDYLEVDQVSFKVTIRLILRITLFQQMSANLL